MIGLERLAEAIDEGLEAEWELVEHAERPRGVRQPGDLLQLGVVPGGRLEPDQPAEDVGRFVQRAQGEDITRSGSP